MVRLGVIGCTAVVALVGFVYLVRALDRLDDAARANAAANYDDREFGGGNSLVVDKRALYEMRALVARDETYRVVTGPGVQGATDLTEPFIEQFARYFLMPRRPDPGAAWILCYGCDAAEIAQPTREVWDSGVGISILRATS